MSYCPIIEEVLLAVGLIAAGSVRQSPTANLQRRHIYLIPRIGGLANTSSRIVGIKVKFISELMWYSGRHTEFGV